VRRARLKHLVPPLFIFFLVMGSIYAGFATPTEAAAVGAVAALILVGGAGRPQPADAAKESLLVHGQTTR
jgi:C4-dicarboxylate transporter, DctM subunit